jgi:tRNA-Thr(GGU) m(6)t(6)A37 methyltransferase TsaA
MPFTIEPIGWVRSSRKEPLDDDWDSVSTVIALDPKWFTTEAVQGLEDFSHIEVVYVFDRVDPLEVQVGARHPRGNKDWPKVGILAQRAKSRPNRLGVSSCQLLGVDGLELVVRGLDAIDATPVLDVKPYMVEFAPRAEVHQPSWSHELMRAYWSRPREG